MIRWTAMLVLASISLAACTKHDDAAASTNQATTAAPATVADATPATTGDSKDYYTALPLKEFMPHVMQYAADGIWKRQGYVITEAGEKSLFPKNTEEWEEAESGALALAEMTNVLLLPGRRIDDPRWIDPVKKVRSLAIEAAAAAERQDEAAFFAAGGELDGACESCHLVYAQPKAQTVATAADAAGKTN